MMRCKNCETPLEGPFCARCGQRDIDLERPLSELLREVVHETLDIDGRAIRTLWTLFRRPGLLTSEFLAGRRKHYSPPFRLYLVISLLFFVIAGWVVGRGVLLGADQTLQADAPGQARFVSEDLPRLMFVLLPVFALLLKAAYRQRLYFHHLIHALHLHSAAYVLLAFLLPLEDAANRQWWAFVMQLILIACLFGNLLASLRRVYRASWWVTTGKGLGIVLAYVVLVAGVSEALSHVLLQDSAALPFLTD